MSLHACAVRDLHGECDVHGDFKRQDRHVHFEIVSHRKADMRPRSVRSLLLLLTACLTVVATAAQTTQLKVFRGTLVHSRLRTEMEVLEDYLIGFNESNLGRVSTTA